MNHPPYDATAFQQSLDRGRALIAERRFEPAMEALERAHRLGQSKTGPHVRAHWAILEWGWAQRDRREIAGQLMRIIYSALFTWLWVPAGNRGSTRAQAWQREGAPPEDRH